LGYPAALDAVGNVAAPLLAGFSLASVVVVAADPSHFRWSGAAILALAIAALLLVNAVQCSFHARRNLWSASDVQAWWPELNDHPAWEVRLREEQDAAFEKWRLWSRWTTRMYNAGIFVLIIGLICVLPPPSGRGNDQMLRWLATAFAVVSLAAEGIWIILSERSKHG
jgi:hypothetical protein